MADMKQIFTYPSNSGTDWIDPTYVGNATSGLTQRVDELLAGTYKGWSNLDPVSDLGTTTSEAMQNLSKFITYEANNQTGANITFYDFWTQPIVVANKIVIAADATVQSSDILNPSTITTTANYEFVDSMAVRLTGMDGSWLADTSPTTDYYVKVIDADELQISRNSALTDLIGFISTTTLDVTSDLLDDVTAIQVTFPSSYNYPDGMAIDVNSVQFNGQAMVGNTYYVKEVAAPVYELYQDVGLTNPLTPDDIVPFVTTSFLGDVTTNYGPHGASQVTVTSALTSNELAVYPTNQSEFTATGEAFPDLNEMYHLRSGGGLDYELYYDSAMTQPVQLQPRDFSLAGWSCRWLPGRTDSWGNTDAAATTASSYNPMISYPGGDWMPYFNVVAITVQPYQGSGSGDNNPTQNLQELVGQTLYGLDNTGSPQLGSMFYDSALTQPVSRDSLNPDLFTYANDGAANFALDTNSLTAIATVVPTYFPEAWYAKSSIQDFIPASTRVYKGNSTMGANANVLFSDEARTLPFESWPFNTPNSTTASDINWMPNGSPSDTAQINLSNRSQTLEKIEIYNVGGTGESLEGDTMYLTDVGGKQYEMYTDAAKTQPITADNILPSAILDADNTRYIAPGIPPITTFPVQNKVTSLVELEPLDLIFYNDTDKISAYGTNFTFLQANTWYNLSRYGTGTTPYEYLIGEGKTPGTAITPTWDTTQNIPDIQPYDGIVIDYNSSQLMTTGGNARSGVQMNIGTITGNGQNLNNTRIYQDTTTSGNQGLYKLYTDAALSNPLLVQNLSNSNTALTKTYQLAPSLLPDGSSNGFNYTDGNGNTAYMPFTEATSVNSDTSLDGNLKELGARKFIFDSTDIITTDNKLFEQAGLLSNGTDYYLDFVFKQAVTSPSNTTESWGLFTSFNDSLANPGAGATYSAGTAPFTNLLEFPPTPIAGDESLNYNLYNNSPYDHDGNNIIATYGAILDDGSTVTLNDPINHASTFGWFTLTTYNNFANTVAVDETIRLSSTENCRYTGFLLNGDRLFELVDNNDVKIPVNLANYPSTSVAVTTSPFLPADHSSGVATAPYDYPSDTWMNVHTILDTVTLDSRKPYVFWDSSNNFYVGMWTGQKVSPGAYNTGTPEKTMMFWTKAGWAAGERHLVDTQVPATLETGWFVLAPTSTRASSATFNFEEAFTFNNIAGNPLPVLSGTPKPYVWGNSGAYYLSNDYSVQGTTTYTEPAQPHDIQPGDPQRAGTNLFPALNTGHQQYNIATDIIVPALQRHTLSNATNMVYVETVTWPSSISISDLKDEYVVYNATYNNTDTTANPYYGYFNHGDIIDLPGVDGTGTASYILLKRGSNTDLQFRWTDVSTTPDPTTDITTETMTGEVWSVIALTESWTDIPNRGAIAGQWNNNAMWLTDAPNNHTSNGSQFSILFSGPIQGLPMFTQYQAASNYPQTVYHSSGLAYTASCTVRAGNIAVGTPYTSSQFEFIPGQQTLTHTNNGTIVAPTPWELGTVPVTSWPTSLDVYNGFAGMPVKTMSNRDVSVKRYITPSETHNLYAYQGNLNFNEVLPLVNPTITWAPAYQGNVNITFGLNPTPATQGTISLSPNHPQPYKIDSVDIVLPGNKTYSYQDTNNATVYQAYINANNWYEPGTTQRTKDAAETAATYNVTVDTGKLNSVTLTGSGRYDNAEPQLLLLESPANTYVPPTPTQAELEDVWDTQDQWASDGYTSPGKEWPDHVTPMSAEINYSSPTIANLSQSGIKYTRSAGHTKWQLDVVYPPMSAEDFKIFHAISQAAHGQSTPFYFNLIAKDGGRILWKDFYDQTNTTTSPRFKDAIVAGDTLALFEGFSSNEPNAFMQGEVFIDGQNENGYLHTALSGTASNIFGEAKIRTPWPYRNAQPAGQFIYKDPAHAVVTLADDNFTWSVDVNNYYYVSVSFDLDAWK